MGDREIHSQPIDAVVRELSTDLDNGLTPEDVRDRLQKFGLNELTERPRPGFLALLWDQFNNYLVIILIVAAVIAALLGEYVDAVAIMCIVVLNAVIGVVQESKAEQALAALKKMAAPNAQVLRDGHQITVAGPGAGSGRSRPPGGGQLRAGRPALGHERQPQDRGGLADGGIGARGEERGPGPGQRSAAGRPPELRLPGHADHVRARQGDRDGHRHAHADRAHRRDDPVLRGGGYAAPEEAGAPREGAGNGVHRHLRGSSSSTASSGTRT